jgi:hypothetical protein
VDSAVLGRKVVGVDMDEKVDGEGMDMLMEMKREIIHEKKGGDGCEEWIVYF